MDKDGLHYNFSAHSEHTISAEDACIAEAEEKDPLKKLVKLIDKPESQARLVKYYINGHTGQDTKKQIIDKDKLRLRRQIAIHLYSHIVGTPHAQVAIDIIQQIALHDIRLATQRISQKNQNLYTLFDVLSSAFALSERSIGNYALRALSAIREKYPDFNPLREMNDPVI